MTRVTSILAGFMLALLAVGALAVEPVNSKNRDGKAIRGYDPVAYFMEQRPVKGLDQYTYDWQGATWYFSTADNRDLFAAEPGKWAPQYGGWCAYAMALGNAVNIDPDAFTIYEGRLYLNYSLGVQRKWLKDKDGYIGKADLNYPRLIAGD